MRSDRRPLSRAVNVVATCVAGAAVSACSPPQTQGLLDQIPDTTMSRAELRVRVIEIASEIIGMTKARSYEIYATAQDSQTRWAALQIAVRSNEILVTAATHADPVAALLDTWALIVQWRYFVESETGQEIFLPEYTDDMLANLIEMEGKITALAEELTGPERLSGAVEKMETWARDHPLTARMYRPSFTTEVVGLLPDNKKSIFSVAETLDESVGRVALRLEILNGQLPQQIVWHAGMLIEKRLGDVDIEALAAQSERAMTVIEELPQLIDAERDDIFRQIDVQREEIFRQVDVQRTETIEQVEQIRDETLVEIDRQRQATIASLEGAVATTMDRIHNESTLTVAQVEGIATALVDDVNERVLVTVDRAFRRLLILVGVGLAGAAAIATWAFRRPPQRQITEPR